MPNLNDMNLKMFVAAIAVVCGMVCGTTSAANDAVSKYELNVKDFSQLIVDDSFNVEYKAATSLQVWQCSKLLKKLPIKSFFKITTKGNLLFRKHSMKMTT